MTSWRDIINEITKRRYYKDGSKETRQFMTEPRKKLNADDINNVAH